MREWMEIFQYKEGKGSKHEMAQTKKEAQGSSLWGPLFSFELS